MQTCRMLLCCICRYLWTRRLQWLLLQRLLQKQLHHLLRPQRYSSMSLCFPWMVLRCLVPNTCLVCLQGAKPSTKAAEPAVQQPPPFNSAEYIAGLSANFGELLVDAVGQMHAQMTHEAAIVGSLVEQQIADSRAALSTAPMHQQESLAWKVFDLLRTKNKLMLHLHAADGLQEFAAEGTATDINFESALDQEPSMPL